VLYLRQICLVAARLNDSVGPLCRLLGTPVAHVDPEVEKFGLENSLLAIGTQFLEVVAPIREGTAAARYLDRRGGDGGYMVITQALSRAEQDNVRARAEAAGVRVAYESDRGHWRLMQLHPGDMRAAFLEVEWDEVSNPVGHWEPAGGLDWQEAGASADVFGIVGATLQSDDPDALAARWASVIGAPVEHHDGVPVVVLADAVLRFVPDRDGRGPGLSGLQIAAVDPPAIEARALAMGLEVSTGAVSVSGMQLTFVSA